MNGGMTPKKKIYSGLDACSAIYIFIHFEIWGKLTLNF